MIALAIATFYGFPVAYKAFSMAPMSPALIPQGSSSEALNIDSTTFCGISTIPSTYITRSDASVSAVVSTNKAASSAAAATQLSVANLQKFLSTLYINFIVKISASLSVAFLTAYYVYLFLSQGLPGTFITSSFAKYI